MVVDEKFADDFKRNVIGRGMYSFYENIQEYMPMLIDIVNRYGKEINYKPEKLDFSIEYVMNLTLDFLKKFNPSLHSRLLKNLNVADVIMLTEEDVAKGMIPSTCNRDGKLLLKLEPCCDVIKLCTVPHEFTHGCSQRHFEKKPQREDLLIEIESKFIEKVYADWLFENGIISKQDYQYHCDVQLQDLVYDCKTLLNENFILKQLNHDFSKENIQRIVDDKPHSEKTIIRMAYGRPEDSNFWGGFVARYVIGGMVAQILYEDYQSFPVSTSSLFDEYMSKNADMGLEEGISFLIGENYINRINNTFFPKNEQNQ